ncbi:MAG TPA: hypothetical protein VKB93_14615, partial [Thermoanaerobaculia bacterium]|nr:hypothetical protein [Thermoanaerobaculia bacterium]
MNWKTWTLFALLIIAGFAIYTFAAPEVRHTETAISPAPAPRASREASTPGVEPVHLDLLDADSGSYKSDRNIF